MTPNRRHRHQALHFEQDSTTDMTPPGDGDYEGLAIFQDPVCNLEFDLAGNPGASMKRVTLVE